MCKHIVTNLKQCNNYAFLNKDKGDDEATKRSNQKGQTRFKFTNVRSGSKADQYS